ncbi:MAG TPA: chorismate-binding protein, partial [Cyclobacteriaceae bacterium]|nr:chorismate-binding protein [Cyclobacteriaceae bacterium]
MHIVNDAIASLTSEAEYLSMLSSFAFENGMSMALWRLPDDPAHHLILSDDHHLVAKSKTLEDLPHGFIFAPFNSEKGRIFLESDLYFVFKDNRLARSETPKQEASLNWLSVQAQAFRKHPIKYRRPASAYLEKDKDHFITMVENAIQDIGENRFEKVVPSRFKKMDLPESFDAMQAFQKLCLTYPNTLVSFVHIPGTGTWLGASPETLVSVENGSVFKTVALAGTKPYQAGVNIKSVAWTQKEIEEQALVERYIISCFKKIRLREFDEHGPKTVVAGNLLHLKSDFTVDMKATNFPQLGSVMLDLLHPTSAVCGMPLDGASKFLATNEGYDRE